MTYMYNVFSGMLNPAQSVESWFVDEVLMEKEVLPLLLLLAVACPGFQFGGINLTKF